MRSGSRSVRLTSGFNEIRFFVLSACHALGYRTLGENSRRFGERRGPSTGGGFEQLRGEDDLSVSD